MRKASIDVAYEGVPFIFFFALTTIVFALLDLEFLAYVGLILTGFAIYFFRDPERFIPKDENVAVSPADGKIIKISTMKDPFTGEDKTCVCIFMNVFNVHVNRMPLNAKIDEIKYFGGKFFNASLDKASTDNERCAYSLVDNDDNKWSMVQIAGLIARRIVCRAEENDELVRGERFGLIRFGSRVDVYLPESYSPSVRVGEHVVAGESIIAKKNEAV